MGFLNLLINFIQPIINVIKPIVNVIKTVIEQAQTYLQQGTSGSGTPSGSSSAAEASRPRGPSPEEIYQMEQAQQAADFDTDIARVAPNDALLDEEDTLPIPSRASADLNVDIAQFLQGDPTPAELLVAVAGNPVAQALLQMLRHERPHLELVMQMAPSVHQAIVYLFGLAEEDSVQTAEAAQICTQALSIQAPVYDPAQMTAEEFARRIFHNSPFANGPAFNFKTGERYSMRGGPAIFQGSDGSGIPVSQDNGCTSLEDCIEALEAFNITIVTQNTPDNEIPSNYANTMSLAGDFNEADLQAIYNAMVIMQTAAAELPELQAYLENGHEIHIVPMDDIPGRATTTAAGLPTPTPFPIIGQGVRDVDGEYRVIELDLNDWRALNDPQQKSWMVIHEFFEINTLDQGLEFDAGNAPPEIAELVNSIFFEQVNEILQANRSYPSRYAQSANRQDDFIIEAMTGTVWNSGYGAIENYDSGAGGRSSSAVGEIDSFIAGTRVPPPAPTDPTTGLTPTPAYQFRPDEFKATSVPGLNIVVRNVRDIGITVEGEQMTLEDFVRIYLFGANSYPE